MDQSIAPGPEGSAAEPGSVAVVEAVAARETVDPLELDPPRHDVVDTHSLEERFPPDAKGRSRREGHVTFVYGDRVGRASSDHGARILEAGVAGNGETGLEDA